MATIPTSTSFVRLAVGVFALLAVAACEQTGPRDGYPQAQSTEPPVMMQTDAASYAAGTRMSVRLTNRTGGPVGYNLCRSRLERRNDEGDWRQAQPALAEVCTAELRTLSPGQSASFAFSPSSQSRRGSYRVVTPLDGMYGRPRVDVVSNTFMLTRDSD